MMYHLKQLHELYEIDELSWSIIEFPALFKLSKFQVLELIFFIFHLQEVKEELFLHKDYHVVTSQKLSRYKFRRMTKETQAFYHWTTLKV